MIEVFTNGAYYNNGKLNARSSSRIWYGPNNERNLVIRVPGNAQSNQVREIVAIIAAVNATPPFQPLVISTDSKYVINGLTTHLGQWQNRG
jgi:ribonuclease HI